MYGGTSEVVVSAGSSKYLYSRMMAIQLSLDMIENSSQTEFIVASDSLTAIKTIVNTAERSELVQRLMQRFD